jgi:hypothetical protein
MGDRIVAPLDLVDPHRLADARPLVDLPDKAGNVGIIRETTDVAFEGAVIGGVEANERHESADVGLGEIFASDVAVLRQMRFELVERREDAERRFLIGRLLLGEAGPIDAIVERVVDQRIPPVDRTAQYFRIKSLVSPVIPSKAVFSMRMMSADSLLTMRPSFMSQRTGTDTLPV